MQGDISKVIEFDILQNKLTNFEISFTKITIPENFAIVVNTGAGNISQTGDNSNLMLFILIAMMSAVCAAFILRKAAVKK